MLSEAQRSARDRAVTAHRRLFVIQAGGLPGEDEARATANRALDEAINRQGVPIRPVIAEIRKLYDLIVEGSDGQ